MSSPFNKAHHTFTSPAFGGLVNDAIAYFEATPLHHLHPSEQFNGGGVYALYYAGDFKAYEKLAALNTPDPVRPIYVGKAVPQGWRTARSSIAAETDTPLFKRLREHARSIQQVGNLSLADFKCRFMVVSGDMADLVVPIEAELIRRKLPLWNTAIDGFGNHDPGSGRYGQSKSEWDLLHPGRPWAENLTGVEPKMAAILAKAARIEASY